MGRRQGWEISQLRVQHGDFRLSVSLLTADCGVVWRGVRLRFHVLGVNLPTLYVSQTPKT
jgi:hypothetical protein